MENQDKTDAASELSLWFVGQLEPYIRTGLYELLQLQKAIRIYGIESRAELLRNASALSPVLVKSEAEQDRFLYAVEQIRAAMSLPVTETVKENKEVLPEKPAEWLEKIRKIRVWFLLPLIIALAYPLFRPSPMKSDSLIQGAPVIIDTVKRADIPKIPEIHPLKAIPKPTGKEIPVLVQLIAALFASTIACASLALLIAVRDNAYERQKAEFDKKYKMPVHMGWPHTFIWPDQYENIRFGKIWEDFINVYSLQKTRLMNCINFPETIYHTIRNAGFFKFRYTPLGTGPACILLLEYNGSGNQHTDCLKSLYYFFRKHDMSVRMFYYDGNPGLLYEEKEDGNRISFEQFTEKYKSAFLFVLGTGYGFVEPFRKTPTDTYLVTKEAALRDLLLKWDRRILLSPQPRQNWSSTERVLSQFISIFPVTAGGINLLKREITMIFRQTRAFPGNPQESYQEFPVSNKIAAYQEYFKDVRLLCWLCCLAISDHYDLSITIAIGKAIEKHVFNDEPLVTFFNLMKLTSVAWLQTGVVGRYHRSELITHLREYPEAQALINTTSEAMISLLEGVRVEKESILEMDRDIRIAVYRQWVKKEGTLETAYLSHHKLLDGFAMQEFAKDGKIRKLSFWKEYKKKLILAGIGMAGLLFVAFSGMPGAQTELKKFAGVETVADSFAYYNNKAVDILLRNEESTQTAYRDSVMKLLDNAERFKPHNDTLKYNREAINYLAALLNYRKIKDYGKALRLFNNIPVNDINASQPRGDSAQIYAIYGRSACYYMMHEPDSACAWRQIYDEHLLFANTSLGQLTVFNTCDSVRLPKPDTIKQETNPITVRPLQKQIGRPGGNAGAIGIKSKQADKNGKKQPTVDTTKQVPIPAGNNTDISVQVPASSTNFRVFNTDEVLYLNGEVMNSISLSVTDNDNSYLLTCGDRVSNPKPGSSVTDKSGFEIGTIRGLNQNSGVLLTKIAKGVHFKNYLMSSVSIDRIDTTSSEAFNSYKVIGYNWTGRVSVSGTNVSVRINEETGKPGYRYGLIRTTLIPLNEAILLDYNGAALGIFLGSDKSSSYFYPLYRLFREYNFRLDAASK